MKNRALTLPNLLTLLRILLIPVFLWEILQARFTRALIIFFIAGFTDWLDGFLARRLDQRSELGQLLDPIADKLLLTTTYIVLTLPDHQYQPIPLWLTLVTIGRDLAIVIAALAIKKITGFKDFKPSQPGKWNTAVLLATVLAFLATNSMGRYTEYLIWFYALAFGMTIFSGLHYIYFINRALNEYRRNYQRE